MPGSKSYVGLVASSEKLLAAVAANPEQLQAVETQRAQFELVVSQLRTLVTRRDTMKADKQTLSRQLQEVAHLVNDSGLDLRAMIKATLGSRSEKLTEFDVRPRRKVLRTDKPRSRKAAAKPDPESPAPTTPIAKP